MARNEPTPPDTQHFSDPQSTSDTDGRKPYNAPAITHELALETRAGSPLGMLNPFDPRAKA